MANEKPVKKEDRVKVMIPFIEGDDPELTVGVNGKFYKIIKGEEVEVPRAVASILSNSYKQEKAAMQNRKRFQHQVTDL